MLLAFWLLEIFFFIDHDLISFKIENYLLTRYNLVKKVYIT